MTLSENEFIQAIADHLSGDVVWAEMVLSAHLESENIDFGDPDYDWTAAGAQELAEIELSYGE